MLKRIKLKNSTILTIGLIFLLMGFSFGFYEYFSEKKEKAFEDMNILLFENETPINIPSDEELEEIKKENLENPTNDKNNKKNESNLDTKYSFIGTLEIPKINVKRGFLSLDSKYNNVDYNITVIKGSQMPDEVNGNLILASHSGNCQICFFNKLYKLGIGDLANIYYNGITYNYAVVNIYEEQKDGKIAIYRDYSKNVLTLITCTKNSDTLQTIYILELQSKN